MRPLAWLDPWILRRPFEGRAASRYAAQRSGFGDLEHRVVAALAPALATARVVLDLGAGRGELAARIAAAYPAALVIAVEPSRAMCTGAARDAATRMRAAAEALPLGNATVDVAVCLSSVRHTRDRRAAFAELRRVVRPGGVALVIELDPSANRRRRARHRAGMRSTAARALFSWLVLPACPSADELANAARAGGWHRVTWRADPLQPVYAMRLA